MTTDQEVGGSTPLSFTSLKPRCTLGFRRLRAILLNKSHLPYCAVYLCIILDLCATCLHENAYFQRTKNQPEYITLQAHQVGDIECTLTFWKKSEIQKAMGIGPGKFKQVQEWNEIFVAEFLTDEDAQNLKDFADSCSGIAFPIEVKVPTVANPDHPAPQPPTETGAEIKWCNPYPNTPLMMALEDLSNAVESLRDLGYSAEIDIKKLFPDTGL